MYFSSYFIFLMQLVVLVQTALDPEVMLLFLVNGWQYQILDNFLSFISSTIWKRNCAVLLFFYSGILEN